MCVLCVWVLCLQVMDPVTAWDFRDAAYARFNIAPVPMSERKEHKALFWVRSTGRSFPYLKDMLAIADRYSIPYTYAARSCADRFSFPGVA